MWNNKTILACLVALWGLVACSDSKEGLEEPFTPTSMRVSGKVEKGPFVRGSQVEMRTLGNNLVPTGSSYTATIENNTGDFNFGSLEISSPYAKLTADGYFFNEVNGELSNSTIKLDAIVDLSDYSTVNINILTHLKSQRINYLVTKKALGFREANKQAQEELLTQFGLQQYKDKDASQYSIISGDDASGVLIAVSSLILSDRTEAEIVEFLSLLSNEFRTTGKFSANTQQILKSTRNELNNRLEVISDNIKARYNELGYDVPVKDLAYYFDWDDDGIAGNELDDSSFVALSQDKIAVPAGGGDYVITIESDKPYFLTPPEGLHGTPEGGITEENYFGSLYESGAEEKVANIEYESNIDRNSIHIHVKPATFRNTKSKSIMIYNARGAVAAQIIIEQEGNPNIQVQVPKLGANGINMVSAILATLRNAVKIDYSLEGNYVLSEQKKPFSPQDISIRDCWSSYYSALNYLTTIKSVDANSLNCYQPYLNTYIALTYYQLTSHWGGVPYFTEKRDGLSLHIQRTSEKEVLARLVTLLNDAMPDLEEKKNDSFSDANSAFFVSKDVARVLLAYIYCNQNKYSQALPLLEKVISNGYYSLVHSDRPVEFANNSECILGFKMDTRSGESCYPCLDYKEVILNAAECHYYLGNLSQAEDYIDQVCKAKGITVDKSNLIESIATVRRIINSTNYLVFIRRNNLGKRIFGLSDSQTYQLLWPIPYNELMTNPSMTQNPGY